MIKVLVMKSASNESGWPPTDWRNPIAISRLATDSDSCTKSRHSISICLDNAAVKGTCNKEEVVFLQRNTLRYYCILYGVMCIIYKTILFKCVARLFVNDIVQICCAIYSSTYLFYFSIEFFQNCRICNFLLVNRRFQLENEIHRYFQISHKYYPRHLHED